MPLSPTRRRPARTLVAAAAAAVCAAATPPTAAEEPVSVPFDSPAWSIEAAESRIEGHLGRQSLFLKGGAAVLDGVEFGDGIIEFDISFGPERGFCGVGWRVQGEGDFEHFYLRPHQSGQPDSMQYTPNFNGLAGWQLYHGEGYGAAVRFPFDAWIHVRIVVSGSQAEAYVDSDSPVLFMSELKRDAKPGGLAVVVSDFAPAYFSNFEYQAVDRPPLQGRAPAAPETPAGTVLEWAVSDAFDGARLDGRFSLTDGDRDGLHWEVMRAERPGFVNLARLQGTGVGADTTFVRLRVSTDEPQGKLIRFGYSDRVRVYLNGELLYTGDNTYQSRDFRYLGTLGLFDALPLRLAEGENELLFAVSESFGGWGIQALFPDSDGIRLAP